MKGLVTGSYRRHYRVRTDAGCELVCVLRGRSMAVACGDRVEVAATADGEGIVETVLPRRSLFYRADGRREKLIAANVTQVIGVVAVAPAWSPDLLDRWIVAAESNGCRFLIVLNKVDLPDHAPVAAKVELYRRLGYPVVPLSAKRDASPLLPLLARHHSVLVGQSGMGKSTLINALAPDAQARIGDLSPALGAGRHTTTASTLYFIDPESWLIDSPGMHEFGLAHLDREHIVSGFRELAPLAAQCRFRDCTHTHEPGCALRPAAQRHEVDPERLASLRRLLAEWASRRKW